MSSLLRLLRMCDVAQIRDRRVVCEVLEEIAQGEGIVEESKEEIRDLLQRFTL